MTVGAGTGTQGGGYRFFLKNDFGSSIQFVGSSVEWPGFLLDKRHDGHGGWSTLDLINGRDGLGTAQQWVGTYQPNVVLLMTGRNDAWPWIDSFQNYSVLANQLYAVRPGLTIIWSNVFMALDQGPYDTQHCEVQDQALRQVVSQQRALGRDVRYVDNYRRMRGIFDIFSDSVHLNDKGYALFGKGWTKPLRLQKVGR